MKGDNGNNSKRAQSILEKYLIKNSNKYAYSNKIAINIEEDQGKAITDKTVELEGNRNK